MKQDIRLSTDFRENKKRKRLQRELGAEGIMALIDFWLYVRAQYPDGDIKDMTMQEIEEGANWRGETGAFVNALLDPAHQFLHKTKRKNIKGQTIVCYVLHEWYEHQTYAATSKIRSAQATDAVTERWERYRKNKENKELNTQSITVGNTDSSTERNTTSSTERNTSSNTESNATSNTESNATGNTDGITGSNTARNTPDPNPYPYPSPKPDPNPLPERSKKKPSINRSKKAYKLT